MLLIFFKNESFKYIDAPNNLNYDDKLKKLITKPENNNYKLVFLNQNHISLNCLINLNISSKTPAPSWTLFQETYF